MTHEVTAAGADGAARIKPRVRRTHLSLFVRDPEVSARWYEDVLGMEVTGRGPQWVFLSYGRKHHDIALIRADEGAEHGGLGLQHYGLEVEGDLEELRRLYGMLITKDVPVVKTTDHKVGYGVYFTDPDGNRFEFFCETVHDDEEAKRLIGKYNAPSVPVEMDPLWT